MAKQINYQVNFQMNKSDLNELTAALKQISATTGQNITGNANQELQRTAATAKQLEQILNQAWNSKLGQLDLSRFNKGLSDAKLDVSQLHQQLASIGQEQTFNKLASQVLNTNIQLKTSSKLLDNMATTFKNTVRYGISSSIFNSLTGKIQEAFNYSKSLNTSLNDIRIVTDKSADDMERFAVQANKAAKALGQTTRDYTNASLIYYQQGLSDEETKARTETTLRAANVTGQAGADVSEQLTAIWNGYKVTAEETELYIDKVAAVAASTAADLEEMATGMSKVASAANSAGVDIDQLNASLATVISVTREAPETIGTAFRSIYSRLGDLQLNGEDEFGVSLGTVSSTLESMGVEVLDVNGQMRDMGTIMEDLAEKWNGWTRAQKQAAAVAMAGRMQYSRLIALLDNWDMYEDAINVSKDAMGTLQHQQDIYMESTAAHLKQLSTEWERTMDILVDDEGWNGLIDALNGALTLFNNFLAGLGGGASDLAYFGSLAATVFNKQIGASINQAISNFQSFKQNAASMQLKEKFSQEVLTNVQNAHAANGQQIGQAAVEKEAEIAQRLLNIRNEISQERYQELTIMQQQMGLDQDRIYAAQNWNTLLTEEEQAQNMSIGLMKKRAKELQDQNKEFDKQLVDLEEINILLGQIEDATREGYAADVDDMIDELIDREQQMTGMFKNGGMSGKDVDAFYNKLMSGDMTQINEAEAMFNQLHTQYTQTALENEQHANRMTTAIQQRLFYESEEYQQLLREQEAREKIIAQQEQQAQRQQAISAIVQSLGVITMSLTTISGIIQTINNDSLTTEEKVGQILSTLLFALPMIIPQLITLGSQLPTIAIGLGLISKADYEVAVSAGTAGAALWGAFWPVLAVIGGVALAIGAVVVVAKSLYNAYNADAIAAENARKAADNLKETYQETKTAAEELKRTLEDYQGALKTIDKLEKGTNEWKQAIIDANDKALELLETNKELAKYATRDENGLIHISDEGMDKILEEQIRKQEELQRMSADAELQAEIAQLKADMTKFKRENKYEEEDYRKIDERIGNGLSTGNVDLHNRPVYRRDNGSISTLDSASFWSDEEQREILVPAVYQLTDDIKKIVGDNVKTAKDGVIDIFDEFEPDKAYEILEEIYRQQGTYLGKFENATLAEQYAQSIHEANDYYYNGSRGSNGKYEASETMVKAIAKYMSDNNTRTLLQSDLANISEFSNASSSMQQAIIDNIKSYETMGNSLNDSIAKQNLYTDQVVQNTLKLKDEDGRYNNASTDDKQVYENLVKQYNNNAEKKQEDIENQKKTDESTRYNDYMNKFGNNAFTQSAAAQSYAESRMFGNHPREIAEQYAFLKGYDDKIENKGFLWQDYTFYKDGKEVERVNAFDDKLDTEIARMEVELQYAATALEEAPNLIGSVNEFIKDDILDPLNEYDGVLGNLLKSGTTNENNEGVFSAVNGIMSQDQAKGLLKNFDLIEQELNNSDFWERQGFKDAETYIKSLKEWLTNRSNTSDADALASLDPNLVDNMNKYSDKTLDQVLSGELAPGKLTEEYNSLANQVEALRALYPELTTDIDVFQNKALIGTEEWTQALYTLQDKINEINLQRLTDSFNEADKKLKQIKEKYTGDDGKIDFEAVIDDEDFQSTLKSIMDADYSINVEIHAQAEDAFQSFEDATKNIAEQAAKIGENYIVAANDIRELNNAFPGIIQGMQAVGDGTVKLNQDVVKSAMEATNAEMAMSAQSTLDALKKDAQRLRSKQKIYQGMYEAALALANGEGDAAELSAKVQKGFDELESQNNQEKSDTEMDNAKLVTDNSNTNAEQMAKNWSSAYSSAADSAIAFAQTAIQAAQAAKNGEGSVSKGDFGVNYQGSNGKSSESAQLANLRDVASNANSQQDWAKLASAFKQAADAAGRQANDIDGMIAQIGATTVETGKKLSNISSGKGANPSKSGGSNKDPDKMDALEDEKDIYHDIDIILKQIETDLNRVQKAQEKLVGKDLINNLNKQWSLLSKQIDATKQKIVIAEGEAAKLRQTLSAQGVQFASDGTISNYASVYDAQLNYVNSIIAQYNSMSAEAQEKFKDTVETAKKNFETFVSNMERYDEVISDLIPGLQDDITEAANEQIQIQISKFNMEMEIRLDLKEAEKEWNAFRKKVIQQIRNDDILGNARATLQDFDAYYKSDGTGIIQRGTQHVNDILGELRKMDAGQISDVYGSKETGENDRKKALEDLQEYYQQLMKDLQEVEDLREEMHQAHLDMMDEAADKFAEQVKMYEHVGDLIEHDLKLIEMVEGEKAYDKMAKYYEKQVDNNMKALDFATKQKDFWKSEMDAAEQEANMMKARRDALVEGTDEWEAANAEYRKAIEIFDSAKEKWLDAIDEWQDKTEAAVEAVQDKYLNTINEIFKNLNNKVTNGMGLDYVEEEWGLINKKSDEYLDTVNAIYGVQKLQNKYLDALDDTDSISGQRKLNDLMNEEISALQAKDKLTQYDLDRAELRYQIALKQIALEEAQQNKSQLRLRRDSQGNYSYQYVADDSETGALREEISDLYNQLYNLDLDKYRENLNNIYDLWVEYQEKMYEAAQINDPEERAAREALLYEQYGELINGMVEQNEQVRKGLYESTFLELKDFYDNDEDAFKTTLGSKFEGMEGVIEKAKDSAEDLSDSSTTAFDRMVGANLGAFENMAGGMADIIMDEILPEWTSGVQQMADEFAGEGGFGPTVDGAMQEVKDTTEQYEQELEEVWDTAGIVWDDVVNGTDNAIDEVEALIEENDDLIDSYDEQLRAIEKIETELDNLIFKYNQARDAAIAATKAAYEYWQEQQRQAAAEAAKEAAKMTGGNSGGSGGGGGSSSGGSGGGSGSGGDGVARVGDVVTFTGKYYYDSWGTTPAGSRYSGQQGGVVIDSYSSSKYGGKASKTGNYDVHIKSADGKYPDLGWVKLSQLSGYATGGYTGDWAGNDGRLALLHKKELILNAGDTQNMLGALNVLRAIVDSVGSSMLSRMAGLTGIGASGADVDAAAETIEQNVHIEASFPGVQNSREIENAFNNLVNIAAQRTHRK